MNSGFNLACITTFRCDEDRQYFVSHNPARKGLISVVQGMLTKYILVLDFVSGEVGEAF
jgi:hypothetical protein